MQCTHWLVEAVAGSQCEFIILSGEAFFAVRMLEVRFFSLVLELSDIIVI